MKKYILAIIFIAFAGSLHAQHSSDPKHFLLELEYGSTTSINYSALSAFEDNTISYTIPSASFFFGFKIADSKPYYGIFVENSVAHTALYCKEKMSHINILLSSRNHVHLFEHIDLWYGIGVGAALLKNDYVTGGEDKTINRYGLSARFGGGIVYNINDFSFVGVSGGFEGTSFLGGDYDIPTGFQKNSNKVLIGSQIMLNWGVRF